MNTYFQMFGLFTRCYPKCKYTHGLLLGNRETCEGMISIWRIVNQVSLQCVTKDEYLNYQRAPYETRTHLLGFLHSKDYPKLSFLQRVLITIIHCWKNIFENCTTNILKGLSPI